MGWRYDDQFGNGGHDWAMAGMMIFWVIAIALVVWLVVRASDRRVMVGGHSAHQNPVVSTGENSPKAILDRRLANGDINPEQYLEAKNLLGL